MNVESEDEIRTQNISLVAEQKRSSVVAKKKKWNFVIVFREIYDVETPFIDSQCHHQHHIIKTK